MSQKKLIDDINEAFIEIMEEENASRYRKYIKNINDKLIANIETLTPAKVRNIISSESIELKDAGLFYTILSAITLIINNRRNLTQEQKNNLAPIIGVVGIYSITQPKQFVKRLYKAYKNPSSPNEKLVNNYIKTYQNKNKALIDRVVRKQKELITDVQTKAKLQQSQDMLREYRVLKDEKLLSNKNIDRKFKRKYNSSKAINRSLDTELHAEAEVAKLEHSKVNGFRYKIWRTQRDAKVRKTGFHSQVANMRVPIDSDFRVGGAVASAPGDTRLPPSERIRCRCYLVYE